MTNQKRDAQADLAACEKATPGPWEYGFFKADPEEYAVHCPTDPELVRCEDGSIDNPLVVCAKMTGPNKVNNSYFIAITREALPYWINGALTERTLREQAEADVVALVDGLRKSQVLWRPSVYEPRCQKAPAVSEATQLVAELLSQPHPGDPLREELERLRADAAMRDPNGLWRGECGHIWDKRKRGEECPVCRELKRLREALEALAAHCESESVFVPMRMALQVRQALNEGKEDANRAE
jgi:rubrerythrin